MPKGGGEKKRGQHGRVIRRKFHKPGGRETVLEKHAFVELHRDTTISGERLVKVISTRKKRKKEKGSIVEKQELTKKI